MNFRVMLVLGFIACFIAIAVADEDYEGHSVVRLIPRLVDHLLALKGIDSDVGHNVDYLRVPRSVDKPADIVVASRHLNKTRDFLNKHNVPNWVMEDNFAVVVRRDKRAVLDMIDPDAVVTKQMIMSHYLPFDTQIKVLNQLAAALPFLVKVETLGTSTEGRPIVAARIGLNTNRTKPTLWIDGGIHAREWIAHSAALYAVWEFATNPVHYDLLRRVDIVIVPNTNPDGYEFSRQKDRLWRKTRSRAENSNCVGVDANRNYPFHWGEEGVSFNPCREIFCGNSVSSEPEVKCLVDAIIAKKDQIKGYIALHSYGQDILYPWGHTVHKYPEDVDDLKETAEAMASAIQGVAGTQYTVANSADGLYPASGAGDDWAKSVGIKYAYTIELSPKENYYGFELPERFISQVATETFAGLESLAKKISQEFQSFRRRTTRIQRRG